MWYSNFRSDPLNAEEGMKAVEAGSTRERRKLERDKYALHLSRTDAWYEGVSQGVES
jgi:hypothetical protein